MSRRILITGASVAGNTAAWWLGRAGFDVTVVERTSTFRDRGQNIDVRGSGRDVLRRMGLEQMVLDRGTGEEGTVWVDAQGKATARFLTADMGANGPTAEMEILRDAKPAGLSPLLALGAVGVVLGASAILGRRNAPDPSHPGIRRWYRRLDKPGFTPPDAAFGAVWPVLETGMAVGGYRLLRQPSTPTRNVAVGLWLLNTAMVGGWTELFFREKKLGASAAVSGAMVASSAAYVVTAAKVDKPAAATGVPFVAWLGFATLLAERIWRDNPGERR